MTGRANHRLARVGLSIVVLAVVAAATTALVLTIQAESLRLQADLALLDDELYRLERKVEALERRPMVLPGDVIRAEGIGYIQITNPHDVVQRTLLKTGTWERDIIAQIKRYSRPGGISVDAGAYIGTHTLAMARAVGEGGRVYAFDPAAAAVRQLRRNLRFNEIDHVTVIQKALGATTTGGFLRVVSEENPGTNRACTAADVESGNLGCDPSVHDSEAFQMVRFDDLGIEGVSLMKVDVEGHELGLLQGARESIRRDRPVIIIEIWPDEERQGRKSSRGDVLDLLRELGYTLKPLNENDFLALPTAP